MCFSYSTYYSSFYLCLLGIIEDHMLPTVRGICPIVPFFLPDESINYCSTGMLGSVPPSILSSEYWNDIDATTFRIRGKNYIADRVKVTSAPAVFKLIAIDVSDKKCLSFFSHNWPIKLCILYSNHISMTFSTSILAKFSF